MSETLKYPAGGWTHADFAEANGKTKPSVYNQLQDALKNGTVVVCGSKSSGKGKPSKLYKVNDGTAVTVTKVTEVEIPTGQVVEIFDVKIDTKSEVKSEVLPEPVTESVVVAEVTSSKESEDIDEKIDRNKPIEMHLTDLLCPICHNKVHSWQDAGGVWVMCRHGIEVCTSTENPYGHGRSEKAAHEIMCQKWTFGKGRN